MFKSITLEMSLKPFKKTDSDYIKEVCSKVWEQWKPLVKNSETISVMFWTADGSELLDYRGSFDDSFEWCYMVGGANNREEDHSEIDPDQIGLHSTNYNYIENPPVMTYGILKEIVATFKSTGSEMFPDKKIRVGTTFDPGPEFAKSSFKYERHNEICTGGDMGHKSMVCAYTVLNGDNVHYAAYPDGIPDGTPFGTFFGKQTNIFLKDMGFDYIWLSNGFGFGRETWSTIGAVFDGERFDYSVMDDIKADVLNFWKLFRKECPDYPVETRGTNMSMGIDFATDGVPLKEIYEGGFNLLPPPNSPWAALNGDFGLELMGYMSRIAHLPPENKYLFRYYIHDPWWANSPWYDRYNGMPHDIYLPMSIGRIDENGKVQNPSNLNLLSIDNSFGDLPDSCANEPIPHLIKAAKESPNEVSPVVWVYPFSEYSNCRSEQDAKEMFFGDWYIRGAINNGFPLSSVTSTSDFVKQNKEIYKASVIVTPVPKAGTEFEKEILYYAENGGKVIFYGNTVRASESFRKLAGIKQSDEISGVLDIKVEGENCGKILHTSLVCGGGINTVCESGEVFAEIGGKAVGVKNNNTVWLRGTVSADFKKGKQLLVPHNPNEYFIGETLILKALGMSGLKIEFDNPEKTKNPVIMLHRYNNAYMLSAFLPSTTVKTKMLFPYGAPVLDGYETRLENGYATYNFPKSEHKEIRAFVEQENGIVSCRELPPVSAFMRRRVKISGLKNATVRFLGESYCKDNLEVVVNSPEDFYIMSEKFEGKHKVINGISFYEARNITGEIVFSMPFEKPLEKRPYKIHKFQIN